MRHSTESVRGRGGLLRAILVLCLVAGITWWLFADTYRRYATAPADGRTIRFAHFGTYYDYELWKSVIAEFERQHRGVRVRQEYIVGLGDQYHTKLRQQILSQSLPDAALVQLGPFSHLAEHFADLAPFLGESPLSSPSTSPRPPTTSCDGFLPSPLNNSN